MLAAFKSDSTFIGNAATIVKSFNTEETGNLAFSSVIHSFRVIQYSLTYPSFHQFLPGINDIFRNIINRCFGDGYDIDENIEKVAFDLLLSATERHEIGKGSDAYIRHNVEKSYHNQS